MHTQDCVSMLGGDEVASALSSALFMHCVGACNGPFSVTSKVEMDPFLCNPSVWHSTASNRLVKVLDNNAVLVESMFDNAFVAAWHCVESNVHGWHAMWELSAFATCWSNLVTMA